MAILISDICQCDCHKPAAGELLRKAFAHKRPCCQKCPDCKRRIRIGKIPRHRCKTDAVKMVENIIKNAPRKK